MSEVGVTTIESPYELSLGPITDRELTILRLLPTHLTYSQIADVLLLSVNTVKSNMKAIYRKLGVANRFDAVAVGRQLELV